MENCRILENKIMLWTKCIVLVLGLITAIPVANHLIRDVYKLVCVWGVLCVLYLLVKRHKNYWTKEYFLLLLFCGFYGVTILLGTREHLINEIAMIGFTGVLFFVLTYCDQQMTKNQLVQELKILSQILVFIPFVFSVIGLLMFVFSISGKIMVFGSEYTYGMFENRLWGLYNPNTGSTINFLSMFASFFLLQNVKKYKPFLWSNIVIQVLCLILTQSRGTGVCFFTFVFLYLLFVKKYKKIFSPIWKMVVYKIATVVAVFVVMIGTNVIVKNVIAFVPSMVSEFVSEKNDSDDEDSHQHRLDRLDKKENNIESISTGRSDMWKIGLNAFAEEPVFGIGFRSIDDVLAEKMTKGGYLNSASGSLHSSYVTVLVSSGIVGFGIFGLFLLFLLKKVLKCLWDKKSDSFMKAICALIPAILVSELVESRIVFGMNIWAFGFWILVGYVCLYTKKGEKIDNSNCASV